MYIRGTVVRNILTLRYNHAFTAVHGTLEYTLVVNNGLTDTMLDRAHRYQIDKWCSEASRNSCCLKHIRSLGIFIIK
jgi:hypothetical protein